MGLLVKAVQNETTRLILWCGGRGYGLSRAGFTEIVGVDNRPQKRYPFEFVLGDALEYVAKYGHEFDMIHASPICKGYTKLRSIHDRRYPDQIPETRRILRKTKKPYVIENVEGSPLFNVVKLCGTMFDGLQVIRHRLFECNPIIWFPPAQCKHILKTGERGVYDTGQNGYMTIAGHNFNVSKGKVAMGIDWMVGKELSQAIPPAYTQWLGKQMLSLLNTEGSTE